MVGAPSTPTLTSHTSGRTVYFDSSLTIFSLGLRTMLASKGFRPRS